MEHAYRQYGEDWDEEMRAEQPVMFVDFLGHAVKVGDFVVYATTSGRSPVQKFAKVVKIELVEDTRWKVEDGQYVRDEHGGIVRETYNRPKVGVREISNGRGFTRFDTHKYVEKTLPSGEKSYTRVECLARVTYPTVENIVKVPGPVE